MRAIADQVERMEMNKIRDSLLNKVKLELKSRKQSFPWQLVALDQSCLPLNLNRQERCDLVDNELKSYRKHLGVGRGRPRRAITIFRELKKNSELLDGELNF
tara:strand:+ start:190 stop:495 length:306 start_codon:yes stop_codon:yes gene_type:complete